MTDNVSIPATGSGTATPSIATDDVSGQHYQRVKISDGVADSATHLGIVVEDVASAGAESGILAMGIRKDTPASTAGTDGDFTYPQFDATGKQWVSGTYKEDTASGDGDPISIAGFKRASAPANTSGTDGDYEPLQGNNGALWVCPLGIPFTVQTTVTRQAADTTQYSIGDAISNSTSAPTSGGFTFANAARKSGGSVLITDVRVMTDNDPATRLSAELLLYDQAVTNINDNAVFAISDTEVKTQKGIVPFSLLDNGNNGYAHVAGLGITVTCVGSADIRFLLRARNAYTPAASEALTFEISGVQID